MLKHLFVHVFDDVLAFRYLEELSQLFLCLLIRVEVHFRRFLQLFPCFELFFTPILRLLSALLEEGRFVLLDLFLLCHLLLVKLLHSPASLRDLLLVKI